MGMDYLLGRPIIQISCSDLLCWSAVQHLLQLRQMLDIMAVATVDMDMAAMVAMDMAVVSMVVATMEREMLMLNQRLMQGIMEDMAIVDMVAMEVMDMAVVTLVR